MNCTTATKAQLVNFCQEKGIQTNGDRRKKQTYIDAIILWESTQKEVTTQAPKVKPAPQQVKNANQKPSVNLPLVAITISMCYYLVVTELLDATKPLFNRYLNRVRHTDCFKALSYELRTIKQCCAANLQLAAFTKAQVISLIKN